MPPHEIHLVAGARPNFMKVAPVFHALVMEDWCRPILIHTGQRYDEEMSEAFLRDLGLPKPHVRLGVGSGSHTEQTAGVMLAYERVCLERPQAWIIVVGGVNSTLACARVAVANSVQRILSGDWPRGKCPDLWDGRTAIRVAKSLRKRLNR